MRKVKTLILRTAGTNCDIETAHAFREAGAEAELVHINALIADKKTLSGFDILAIPGGFTYGDDIASGKILANELRHSLKEDLAGFIKDGKLIIGICNGFQVLVKMGLLPGNDPYSEDTIDATLTRNDSGRFESRWVHLEKCDSNCVWTKGLPDRIYLPVAHGEGKFIPRNSSILRTINTNSQVAFRYVDKNGKRAGYPDNPNGSIDDIAGISDPSGRIFGLMPHPERHITHVQHPHWHRYLNKKEMGIGLHIFKNGVKFVKN